MDTSELKVGDKVWMKSGDAQTEGTVMQVTEERIGVNTDPSLLPGELVVEDGGGGRHDALGSSVDRLHLFFDRDGKQREGYVILSDCFGLVEPLCGKSGEPWQLSEKAA